MEPYASFGSWLRRQRKAHDLTQAALGERVGISAETIRKIEADGRRPSRETAERLAEIFRLAGDERAAFLRAARAGVTELPLPERPAEPAPPSAPAPGAPPPARRHNLPAALTSFVGRARELGQARHQLAGTRLLTIAGAGGAGKTRLALELARGLLPAYPGGVWLVELAPLADGAMLARTVASTLDARDTGDAAPLDALIAAIGEAELLLVLDNCEHLAGACAELTARLLAACPGLRVLATSREPLGVPGEQIWRMPPLATPNPDQLPPLDDLLLYDAVRLFVERAAAVRPGFAPEGSALREIALICARLDGLPLAIELAAAWTRALSVAEIGRRLEDRLALLVGGSRAVPTRQQTLRAALDWSYDLLADDERRLFARLALFADRFTLAAAEAVGQGDGVPPAAVMPLLVGLADKSLVSVEPEQFGERWYRLLETVRAYGRERLDASGEAEATHARHLAWILNRLQSVSDLRRAALTNPIDPWLDDIRAALAYTLDPAAADPPRAEQSLDLVMHAARCWEICGYLSEGRRWIDLAIAANPAPGLKRSRALAMAGNLAKVQGDVEFAEAAYTETLAWFRAAGEQGRVGAMLNNLGNLALERGDYEDARDLYEEALAIRRAEGNIHQVASTLNNLGELAVAQGDYERAARMYTESLANYREVGDDWAIADLNGNLGWLAFRQGHDLSRAAALLEASLAEMRAMSAVPSVALRLAQLGALTQQRGDPRRAAAYLAESLQLWRQLDNKSQLAAVFEGIAGLVAGTHPEVAARLCGAADTLRQAARTPRPPDEYPGYQRLQAALRAALGEGCFATLRAEGAALSQEEAASGAAAVLADAGL